MTDIPLRRDRFLRVAINAQLPPGRGSGGAESVLIGLVRALGELDDGPEEYVIIGPASDPDWLKPYTSPNQRIISGWQPQRLPRTLSWLKQTLGLLCPPTRQLWHCLFPRPLQEVPISDGFYESLGCDVIHFPYQDFVLCALPSVYNPHDLLHRHYPQFFDPSVIAQREKIYSAGCHLSETVAVGSQWVKEDVLRHYGVSSEKVQVIPWAPPTQAYTEVPTDLVAAVQSKYQLQTPFAYYPAMIWEHKNHLRLLDAVAYLRDSEALKVRLVCTGHCHPRFWPSIEERLAALGLSDQVRFLGLVSASELRAMYRLAQFVVIPTLFEAASAPMFEAWGEGVPVACSTVTSLPEQAGGAALLFDPYSVEAIAGAIQQMAADSALRECLRQSGARRLQDFSWERTAKAYRALYRRAARRALTDEDRYLLEWDWMRGPKQVLEASL